MLNEGKTLRKYLFVLALLLSTLLASACGYSLRGTQGLTGNPQTVAVMPFVNKTVESRVEVDLFNALVDEFAQSKNLKIVPAAKADLLVNGAIVAIDNYPISYSVDDKTNGYRTVMTIDVEVKDRATNRVVWRRSSLQQVEEYGATDEPLSIDRRKQLALKKICRVLAEDIHDGIFRDF